MQKAMLCGITYCLQSPEADLAAALDAMETQVFTVVTPNAEIAGRALGNAALRAAVMRADLVLPDGDGVVLASRLAGAPIPCRRTGVDFANALLCAAAKRGLRLYLLGGKPGVAERAARRIRAAYPSIVLCGVHNGYFNVNDIENEQVLANIAEEKPHITFVCMGAPRQEVWLAANRHRLPHGIYGGFGGVLDLWAGDTTRAPKLWQTLHAEWLYRVARDPKRIGRLWHMLPLFAAALAQRFGRKWEDLS